MYAKIQRSIWRHPGLRALPEDARILFLYLITCSHGYDIGLFPLPDAYACDDLQWTQTRFDSARSILIESKRAFWDTPLNLVCLPHSIKYNPPANPKVLVRWRLQFEALPPTPLFAYPIKCAKNTILDTWAKPFLDYLDTLSIQYQDLINTVSITVTPYPIPHTVTITVAVPPTPRGLPQAPVGGTTTTSEEGLKSVEATGLEPHLAEISTLYEANIGNLSPYIGQQLQSMLDSYGLPLCSAAVLEAKRLGKCNLGYIQSICVSCHAEGRLPGSGNGKEVTRKQVKLDREWHKFPSRKEAR